VTHHTYTNVIGKDDDFGYLFFRLSSDVPWKPRHLFQTLTSPLSGVFFDHAVAYYHARPSEYLTAERGSAERTQQLRHMLGDWLGLARKSLRHYAKEYAFYPALAGPFALKVALGNACAQGLRNLWTYVVIHCGHLPEATNTFSEEDLKAETRGAYYLRQIMGSSNIEAGPLLSIFTGHLSHQIEHHLFPTVPAHRYREISGDVKQICERHGIPYHSGSLGRQFASVLTALARYSLPNASSDERRRGRHVFKLPTERPALQATS
jgi:fatty acid desaturase